MADTEFEQFRQCFERLPQHLKATAQTYTLVHDLALDDDADGADADGSPTRSDSDDGEGVSADEAAAERRPPLPRLSSRSDAPPRSRYAWSSSELGLPGLAGLAGLVGALPVEANVVTSSSSSSSSAAAAGLPPGGTSSSTASPPDSGTAGVAGAAPGRRRRRLPEIPQSAKNAAAAAFWGSGCAGCSACRGGQGAPSLAAELGAAGAADLPIFAPGGQTRPLLVLKCGQDAAGPGVPGGHGHRAGSPDSGHSTMHSPQLQHDSLSTNSGSGSPTPSSADGAEAATAGRLPGSQLELLEATHRGLYKFVPRHRDEVEVEIGDLIYVQKEADDLWCEGVNLRTGQQGCFPSAYAVDLEYADLDPSEPRVRRERFLVRYLGSVETHKHKGTNVLAAAVAKMVDQDGNPRGAYTPCVLEVSDKGLRMSDSGRGKRPVRTPQTAPLDYFYSLKHVSFCAYLPRDQRYLGFITKHPQLQRFACHVFQGQASTRPVAESVGRAFQRFYQKYVETAFPVEDIYID